jgi:hypothetical protein
MHFLLVSHAGDAMRDDLRDGKGEVDRLCGECFGPAAASGHAFV